MLKLDLLLGAALLCCACSSDDDHQEHPAIGRFFADFHASRYSRVASRAAELDAAATDDPHGGRLAFDRALAHNWHLQEWKRDTSPDPALLGSEAGSLLGLFQTAYDLNRDDSRVGCFLGLQQVGAGRALQNDDLLQRGLRVLDQAVEAWPEFNLFCVGLAYDHLPASGPDYAKAVDAALDTIDVCVGEAVDRDRPDITPYLGQATSEGPKRACWNDPIAPHNAEGFYLWVGDLLVKQGNVEAAKVAYHNVEIIPEYPSWPYRALLEDRLTADLDAKSALYRDADPANDPEFGGEEVGRRCTVCHAATASE